MLAEKKKELARLLRDAKYKQVSIAPLTSMESSLDVDSAYHVQLENINEELAQGYKITGKKIGLTSKAVQEMLKVDEPDYGHLLNNMEVENGGTIPFDLMLQPKVEGELAFILKKDVVGPNVTTLDVLMATDVIVPALEIVDSRIKDWKITLQDTVADNASSGFYVLGGTPKKVTDVDIKQIGMALYRNDQLINTGVGVAALGNPAKCVAWLANKLAVYGISLKAREVILSGALSGMVEAKPGDHFRAKFADLGEVEVNFSK